MINMAETGQVYKLKKLLLLVCCLLINAVYAQNPLELLTGSDKPAAYQTPSPNTLSVKWWQEAIKNSPPTDPYAQLNELADSLQIYAEVENYQLSSAATQSISQFKNNLEQLSKIAATEVTVEPVAYEKQDSYSLTEIYAYKQQVIDLENSQNQRQDDIDSLRNDAKFQYEAIDDLIIKHRNQPTESLARLETGLLWIEARSWMALYEKQADNLVYKQTLLSKQLLDLKNHLADAVQLIQPDVATIEDLQKSLISLAEQINAVSAKVQAANLKITSAEDDTIVGGFLTDIKKLELANHMLDLNELELEQIKVKAHLDWINSTQPDMELDDDQVLEHVNNASQIKTKTEANQVKWQALAQDILISPALNPALENVKKAKDTALKRTRLAQELLLGLNELNWQLEQVTFIEGLLTKQVINSKSGLNRLWAQIKSYGITTWVGFEKMANKTLFKINETPITLMPLLRLIIIVLIGYLVSKFVRYIIRRVEARRQVDKSSVFFILDKLIHYLIIFVATIAGFTTLGIDFTNLTLIAGALSVGIGFGLQNIVSNFVSGLTIMFERSLKVGDYIEMEDGYTGSVMEINARSTRINTNDNIDVVIPNSDLVTNKIINWTLRDSIKRVKIPFGVAYGTDKELVKTAAIEAAENVTYTLTNMKGKEPEVWMTGFGDNSLDFVLLVWVSKYGVRRPNRIKASFLWELDSAFNKHGIEVPFPQRVVHYAVSKDAEQNAADNTDLKTPE
jgi:small-conductance mechanosensitive channel